MKIRACINPLAVIRGYVLRCYSSSELRIVCQRIQVVSPKELEHAEGDTSINTQVGPYRWQQVFPASDFQSLPESHQVIAFLATRRPDVSIDDPFTETWDDIQIRMSITSGGSDDMSSAFGENIHAPVTIYEGSLTLETANTGPDLGPKDFDQFFELRNPYIYDASQGNLLLDVVTHSGITTSGPAAIDAFTTPTSAVFAFDPDAETGSGFGGTPVQFIFVPYGDFSHNGELDVPDVNLLSAEIAAGANGREYDLTNDSLVTDADLKTWVKDLKHSWIGDANLDGEFNSVDIVNVLQAGKYATDELAGWNDGDWSGDERFDRVDVIAALQDGGYDQGPFAAIVPSGSSGDGQTSVVYNSGNGELSLDAPAGVELTSINIDSSAGIFTGVSAQNLSGSFDNDADNNIFKATFGGGFGSVSFGNVAQPALSEEFLLNDLTVVGSLAGGGDLGNVDLVYVPEPSTIGLFVFGLLVGLRRLRRKHV